MSRVPCNNPDPLEPGPSDGAPPPDHLIDQIFDGAVPNDKVRKALEALRRDRHASEELDWTAGALSALRLDGQTPDLSDIILARTGMKRSWLSAVMQRRVLIGRVTGVAAVLAMVAGAFLMQRYSPATFNKAPTPISGLVRAVPSDAARAAGAVRLPAPDTLQIAIFAPDDGGYDLAGDPVFWRGRTLSLSALRQAWATRHAEEPAPVRVINAGFTSGGLGSGVPVISPTLHDDERGETAAIFIRRR